MTRVSALLIALAIVISAAALTASQNTHQKQISFENKTYPLYPQTLDVKPDIPSPFTMKDGIEILLGRLYGRR